MNNLKLIFAISFFLFTFDDSITQTREIRKAKFLGNSLQIDLISALLMNKINATAHFWALDTSKHLTLPITEDQLDNTINYFQYSMTTQPYSHRPQWNGIVSFPQQYFDDQSQLVLELFHQITPDVKMYVGGTILTIEQLQQLPTQTSLILEDRQQYFVGSVRITWYGVDRLSKIAKQNHKLISKFHKEN